MAKEFTAHVVSHTHWDREWYHPFQQFRMRLVDLIDHLLEFFDSEPDYKHFMLDGQSIIIEDYLAVRPENEEKLRQYIEKGKISVGPWYVLMDEFLVSPESMIRNLMLGIRIAKKIGGVSKIGYMPDQFGQIGQMPQILQGFGIDNAFFGRGLFHDKINFLWQAPDGSEVLATNIFYACFMVAGVREAEMRFWRSGRELRDAIERESKNFYDRATTKQLLLPNGVDHMEPQPHLPRVIKEANVLFPQVEFVHSSLEKYNEVIRKEKPDLDVLTGEFRELDGDWLLQGTFSSRIYLKQMNERCQNALEKWAEPFSALAWTLGNPYPQSFLWESWRWLLQNHPHDSICGCSADPIHREMETRFASSEQISEEIAKRSLAFLAGKIKMDGFGEKEYAIVVFNPLGWKRDEVVTADLEILEEKEIGPFKLTDLDGNNVSFQILDVEYYLGMYIKPDYTPARLPIMRYKVAFRSGEVSSLGYKILKLVPSDYPRKSRKSLVTGPLQMENEYLAVFINPNGSLDILHKETDRIFSNCLIFEDGGDTGDEYNYSYPFNDQIISSYGTKAEISLVEDGPESATFKIDMVLGVPAKATEDQVSRSDEKVRLPISTTVTLTSNSRRIDLQTKVVNTARDHRLRVLFPTGISAVSSYADGHFDVVKRPIGVAEGKTYTPTHHQKTFVDINDGEVGISLINFGLPEYEVIDDKNSILALTLLRCVETISSGDLLTRRGHAGYYVYCPEGQCQGEHTFRYSFYPHRGTWEVAKSYIESWNHNVPMRAVLIDPQKGGLPSEYTFIEITPDQLVLSALKKGESDDILILRFYNISSSKVNGHIKVNLPIREAFLTNLAEEKITEVDIADGVVTVEVAPKKVVTMGFRLALAGERNR